MSNLLQDMMGMLSRKMTVTPKGDDYMSLARYPNPQERMKPNPKIQTELVKMSDLKTFMGGGGGGSDQTLSIAGQVLSLTSGGSVTLPDEYVSSAAFDAPADSLILTRVSGDSIVVDMNRKDVNEFVNYTALTATIGTTVNLPVATPGQLVIIENVGATGNASVQLPLANATAWQFRKITLTTDGTTTPSKTLTLDAQGSNTINGQANFLLYRTYASVTLWSTGADWIILSSSQVTDVPTFTALTDGTFNAAMQLWFSNQAAAEAQYGPIGQWNVTAVTDMTDMLFANVTQDTAGYTKVNAFNEDISAWDVSNVTIMKGALSGVNNSTAGLAGGTFNQDISSWDVSSVTDMEAMFRNQPDFNQPLNTWDVSSVTTMVNMFQEFSFNAVKRKAQFNQPLNNWDVSSVTTFQNMFDAPDFVSSENSFNQDLSSWNLNSATTIRQMFRGATDFNNGGQPLTWTLGSNLTNYFTAFFGAISFNQDVSSWDVSAATSMNALFHDATAFNQDLSSWQVQNCSDFTNMLDDSAMSTTNYDALLNGWSALTFVSTGLQFGAAGVNYTAAGAAAHGVLTGAPNSWTITDAGQI
jgi:surface protein